MNSNNLANLKLLMVDDDTEQAQFYAALLSQKQFDVAVAHNISGLKRALSSETFHAILLDLQLGSEDGLEGIDMVLSQSPATKVFILSAHGSIDRAVEAMRKGASGFFEKGCGIDHIAGEISKSLSLDTIDTPTSTGIDLGKMGLIGQSEALRQVVEKIERLASVDSTVLILGESGTGKEVIARTIHRTSKRAKHRFSAINCGAIPETLLESELFGHKRGAFTDAKADRKGIFEISSSGSLLLDEIGDMPLSLQTKLLRVLQEREITPVGSTQSIKIDTRIIAATHRNIRAEAEEKRFREDLYYRLSIIVINIPALRQRAEDIPLLVTHFLSIFNERFSRNVQMPTQSEMNRLMAYAWPGNIRELQNALERAVVMSVNDRMDLADIFAAVPQSLQVSTPLVGATAVNVSPLQPSESDLFALPLTEAKSNFEKHYLEYLVRANHGNIHLLAEKSGRYRADIYRLLNRHGIDHANYK